MQKSMEDFKKDVGAYHDFLLNHGINVFGTRVSLKFLKAMIIFTDIKGDSSYITAVCYFLKHQTKTTHAPVGEED